jgi:hypothetical protein
MRGADDEIQLCGLAERIKREQIKGAGQWRRSPPQERVLASSVFACGARSVREDLFSQRETKPTR